MLCVLSLKTRNREQLERDVVVMASPLVKSHPVLSAAREQGVHQGSGHENQKQTADGRDANEGGEIDGLVVGASGISGAVVEWKLERLLGRLHGPWTVKADCDSLVETKSAEQAWVPSVRSMVLA